MWLAWLSDISEFPPDFAGLHPRPLVSVGDGRSLEAGWMHLEHQMGWAVMKEISDLILNK